MPCKVGERVDSCLSQHLSFCLMAALLLTLLATPCARGRCHDQDFVCCMGEFNFLGVSLWPLLVAGWCDACHHDVITRCALGKGSTWAWARMQEAAAAAAKVPSPVAGRSTPGPGVASWYPVPPHRQLQGWAGLASSKAVP